MARMILHTHGWKAERDRLKLTRMYSNLVKEFHVWPILSDVDLSKLSNIELHRLNEGIYNKQSVKALAWYDQKNGLAPRTEAFKWRWFWHDLFNPKQRVKKHHMRTRPVRQGATA